MTNLEQEFGTPFYANGRKLYDFWWEGSSLYVQYEDDMSVWMFTSCSIVSYSISGTSSTSVKETEVSFVEVDSVKP